MKLSVSSHEKYGILDERDTPPANKVLRFSKKGNRAILHTDCGGLPLIEWWLCGYVGLER